jgi:hypothetical protein
VEPQVSPRKFCDIFFPRRPEEGGWLNLGPLALVATLVVAKIFAYQPFDTSAANHSGPSHQTKGVQTCVRFKS